MVPISGVTSVVKSHAGTTDSESAVHRRRDKNIVHVDTDLLAGDGSPRDVSVMDSKAIHLPAQRGVIAG